MHMGASGHWEVSGRNDGPILPASQPPCHKASRCHSDRAQGERTSAKLMHASSSVTTSLPLLASTMHTAAGRVLNPSPDSDDVPVPLSSTVGVHSAEHTLHCSDTAHRTRGHASLTQDLTCWGLRRGAGPARHSSSGSTWPAPPAHRHVDTHCTARVE